MNNMQALQQIRWNQYLCRPAGAKRPISLELATSPQFPLTPTEAICVNRRLRAVIQGEIHEEHHETLRQIQGLVKNIFGMRVNAFRALISQLALDESNTGLQVYVTDDQGKIDQMDETSLSACWNRSLADFYFCVESSQYHFQPDMMDLIQKLLAPLQRILRATSVEAFLDQEAYDQFLNRFSLLESCIKEMDNRFAFLLNPAESEECCEITPRHIEIYERLLSFLIGTLQRYHKDASFELRTFKKYDLKNPFLSGILELQKHAKSLKSDLGRMLSLFEMAEKGNQEAIFSLKKLLTRFTGHEIMDHLNKVFIPYIRALESIRNAPSTVLKITQGYNLTLRHGIELWIRMSDALFANVFSSVENCCDAIEQIQPLISCRSAHLTPLDLCRHHWISSYIHLAAEDIRISKVIGIIEMVLQTLQSPGGNIYQKNLTDLSALLEKLSIEIPQGFSQEPLEMMQALVDTGLPEMLCAWLNHSLLQKSNQGNPHSAFLMLLSDLGTYLSICKKQVIIDNPHADAPLVIKETDTVKMAETLLNEIKKQKEHANLEERHLKDFCLNIARLFQPLSSGALQELFAHGSTPQVRDALMIDLFLREDLRTLYLRPFLSWGRELGWTVTKNRESSPITKEAKQISRVLKKDVHEIIGLSSSVKRALQELIDVLDKPFSKEAIYRAAARCLQLVQSGEERDPWRDQMLNRAQIDFGPRSMESNLYEEDLAKTFACIGIQREDIRLPELSEPVYGEFEEVESLRDLLFKAKFDLPLRSAHPLEGETVIQAKWRESMVYEILDAMVNDLDAVEQSLRKAQKAALPPFHLRFLILKAAQIVEGSLLISLLRSTVATSFVMECLKNHDLGQMYQLLQTHKACSDEEISLIDRFKDFAAWVDDPRGHTSFIAQLLTEGEKLFRGSELEKKELHIQQKKLLSPEIKKLIGLSTILLTSNEIN